MAERKDNGKPAGFSAAGIIGLVVLLVVVGALTWVVVRALAGGGKEEKAAPKPSPSPAEWICKNQSPPLLDMRVSRPEPYPMTIDPKKTYLAQITTSCGTLTVKLLANKAPIAVNNFVNLARDNFYVGQVFHRIDRTLGVIQTGDPGCPTSVETCGTGGPGYTIKDEWKNGIKAKLGSVAMASAGTPNSSGSQFEILAGESDVTLPKERTIFGELLGQHSFQVAQLILSNPTKRAPNAPEGAPEDFPDGQYVYIENIHIKEK